MATVLLQSLSLAEREKRWRDALRAVSSTYLWTTGEYVYLELPRHCPTKPDRAHCPYCSACQSADNRECGSCGGEWL